MINILAVIDGLNFLEAQLDPIQYIARATGGRVTIAWLEMIPPPLPSVIPLIGDSFFYSDATLEENIRERQAEIAKNAELLRAACERRGMTVTMHPVSDNPAAALIRESRFADLMLVRHGLSLSGIRDEDPPRFIRDMLEKAQCPVLTLPNALQPIHDIVLAYNGTYSSMYAIRAFLRLMPKLSPQKMTVVYVREKDQDQIPDEALLRHYLGSVCGEVQFDVLEGDPAQTLHAYMREKKETLITLGAYGRSRSSRFFTGSSADPLLQLDNAYVFITHA
ncbi:hypothetical protein ACWKWU_22085 [Chitinophaga lutea]